MLNLTHSQSNKADLRLIISAKDETGADIVFTGANVVFQINDQKGCMRLQATTDNGKAVVSTPTEISIFFSDDDVEQICPGQYPVGAVYELSGETNQLLVGSITFYDGIASV